MRKFICILGILVGIAVTALSVTKCIDCSVYSYGSGDYDYASISEIKEYYGGDAYTGIQNAVIESAEASAITARNVSELGYNSSRFFSDANFVLNAILAFGGLSMFFISVYKLSDLAAEKRKAKKALQELNYNIMPVRQEQQAETYNL